MISSFSGGHPGHKHEAHCPNNHHNGRNDPVSSKNMHHHVTNRTVRNNLLKQDKTLKHNNSYHELKQLGGVVQAPDSDRLPYLSAHDYIPHVDDTPRKVIVVDGPENENKFLRLNVGGSSFCFRRETLILKNEGFLSMLANQTHENRLLYVDAFFENTHEYYFERPASVFHIIYQYYTSGKIHQAAHVCPEDLTAELKFWQLQPEQANSTCSCTQEVNENDSDLDSILSDETEMDDEFQNIRFGETRQKIWALIEEPNSSMYAQIFAGVSVLFVLISIAGLILGSLAELQVPAKNNGTVSSENRQVEMEPHPYLVHMEHVCIVWFIFEYFMKMLATPNHCKTFFQMLNIIDLFAILPFMVEMGLLMFGIDTEQLRDLKGAFLVVRILRVLRVIRVLKLGRYSSGLQMFGKTLRASFRQLGMMTMVVLTGIIFFSTLIYYLEKDEKDSQFYSIPAACWFSIATMSTVGYGDITPTTVGGKLVATAAIACGILVLALPITIIVDNFMRVAEAERHPDFGHNKGKKKSKKKEITSEGALPLDADTLLAKDGPQTKTV